jgi:alpha-N-arabinofuranosidase
MRDAVLAGLTLDTFNRHADKVAMANVAQLINCLHSLFLAHADKFVLMPTFHVFEMYAAHQGATSLRVETVSPRASYTRNTEPANFKSLQGSASLHNKEVTLTVVNADLNGERETEIAIPGVRVSSCQARVLNARDVHAHNNFDNPRAVEPRNETAKVGTNGTVAFHFPPASVTVLKMTLV